MRNESCEGISPARNPYPSVGEKSFQAPEGNPPSARGESPRRRRGIPQASPPSDGGESPKRPRGIPQAPEGNPKRRRGIPQSTEGNPPGAGGESPKRRWGIPNPLVTRQVQASSSSAKLCARVLSPPPLSTTHRPQMLASST